MAKKKHLTKKEKDFNAKLKKEMQNKGILPPDKPKLNRKRFAKEVIEEWEAVSDQEFFYLKVNIIRALFCMVGKDLINVTPEQIGVLKVMKIALETMKFDEQLKKEGRTQYTLGEYYEKVISPITSL